MDPAAPQASNLLDAGVQKYLWTSLDLAEFEPGEQIGLKFVYVFQTKFGKTIRLAETLVKVRLT